VRADKLVLVAGGGDGADGSPAIQAKLTGPFGVAFDRSGNLFIVEMTGQRVRKVDRNGVLTAIAGTGEKGDSGDGGPATAARFNGPHSLAVAANGDIYVSDTWNNRVRRIDGQTGVITAFAGTGEKGFSGDGGPAIQAKFGGIYCVALDPKGGNVYILERSGHALRVVDASGRIRTVAGTGKAGATGDDADARQARLNGPKHLCIDLDGNVLVADTENHAIRKVLAKDGKIIRVAGTGKKGKAGVAGDPLRAELSQPHGVYIDRSGMLYIADSSNDRVLKIEP
jgi:DNA-binding beta-propeller fold protein YncE